MSKASVHRATVRVPATHPALAGHFPGRPIVPGVVLLQCVLDEAERWVGKALSVRTLPQAKFSAPLLPEQDADVELEVVPQPRKLVQADLDVRLTRPLRQPRRVR